MLVALYTFFKVFTISYLLFYIQAVY